MTSNRYPVSAAVEVKLGRLPNQVVCPVCSREVHSEDGEICYHGKNGGAYLCDGSGLPIKESLSKPCFTCGKEQPITPEQYNRSTYFPQCQSCRVMVAQASAGVKSAVERWRDMK